MSMIRSPATFSTGQNTIPAKTMGANLEIFKFAVYLGIPLYAMVHFGAPEWYEKHVQPMKARLWPVPYEETHKPPRTQPELQAELERLRAERLGQRSAPAAGASTPASASVPAAPAGGVLAGLVDTAEGRQDWTAGEKRLV